MNQQFDKAFAQVFGGSRRGERPVISVHTAPNKRQYHGHDNLTTQCRIGATMPAPKPGPLPKLRSPGE